MADSSFNIQNYFKRGKTVVLTLRQGDPDEVRQWSDKDTSQLLSLMAACLPEFRSQRRRKKEVWGDVSKKLSAEGFFWSPEDCRKKWSNMVRTFKGIHEQKSDPIYNSKRTKWPFFDLMNDLFTTEGAESLPEAFNVIQILTAGQPPSSSMTVLSSTNEHDGQTIDVSGLASNAPNPISESQDMVGVRELATIINGNSGDQQVNIEDTLGRSSNQIRHSISKSSTSTLTHQEHVIQKSSDIDKSSNEIFQIQRNIPKIPLKTFLKPGVSMTGKRKKTIAKPKGSTDADLTTPDGILEKFMSMTKTQNEKIIEQMSTFQDTALRVMQERNDVLKRLCTVLEVQTSSSGTNSSNIYNTSSDRGPHETATSGPNHNQHRQKVSSSISQNSTVPVPSYQFSSGGTTTTLTSATSSSGTITIGNLSETMIGDSVAVVDTEALQTIMSQDGSGNIAFHLGVPSSSDSHSHASDNDTRISADAKSLRLENIPSDVNLSAFSATLHPTLVSVVSAKKPRSSLSKSVSVPLHTVNRKIAPRK